MRRLWGRARPCVVVVGLVVSVTGCWPLAYRGHDSETYRNPDNWLCRPDTVDICDGGVEGAIDATVVPADGQLQVEPWEPAERPRFDCFYVYPTVSNDPGVHSDLDWDADEEGRAVRHQAARFGSVCRVFAPVYTQVTATALADGRANLDPVGNETIAYQSMSDAWKHYIANDNRGRDVLLIGHSQGGALVNRLVREEIAPNPRLLSHLVGAYIMGTTIQVDAGTGTGGNTPLPLCTEYEQTGCIVTYNSYRSTLPPAPYSLNGHDGGSFWEPPVPGWEAACTNPVALLDPAAGRDAKLFARPYLTDERLSSEQLPPGPWVDPAFGTVTTPQVLLPDFLEVQCVGRNDYHYLEVTVHGDPSDPRIDDIGGDIEVLPFLPKEVLGLHVLDVNVDLGDLVELAGVQAAALRASR